MIFCGAICRNNPIQDLLYVFVLYIMAINILCICVNLNVLFIITSMNDFLYEWINPNGYKCFFNCVLLTLCRRLSPMGKIMLMNILAPVIAKWLCPHATGPLAASESNRVWMGAESRVACRAPFQYPIRRFIVRGMPHSSKCVSLICGVFHTINIRPYTDDMMMLVSHCKRTS